MVMTDTLGRNWTRTAPGLLSCDDGSTITISADCTDEQAAMTLHSFVLDGSKSALDAAVEAHLHSAAHALGYTDPTGSKHMDRAASYVTSKVWGVQAQALVDWRDDVWLHCYAVLQAVERGERAIPTEAELIAELPQFESWQPAA